MNACPICGSHKLLLDLPDELIYRFQCPDCSTKFPDPTKTVTLPTLEELHDKHPELYRQLNALKHIDEIRHAEFSAKLETCRELERLIYKILPTYFDE